MHRNGSLLFLRVKRMFFTLPLRNFNQSMLYTFHEDPKESYQLVENGHLMSPLRQEHCFLMHWSVFCLFCFHNMSFFRLVERKHAKYTFKHLFYYTFSLWILISIHILSFFFDKHQTLQFYSSLYSEGLFIFRSNWFIWHFTLKNMVKMCVFCLFDSIFRFFWTLMSTILLLLNLVLFNVQIFVLEMYVTGCLIN